MSAYGPALFILRRDQTSLASDAAQREIVELVAKHAALVKLKDDQGEPVKPRFYDYDNYEKGGVGVLLFSSYAWAEMPEEIRVDEEQAILRKLAASIAKAHPKEYELKCYWVED